jgi:hypothetical protein
MAMKTESAAVFALRQLTATFMLTLNCACCSYLEQAFWQKRYKRDEDGNGSQLQRSFRNIRKKHLN